MSATPPASASEHPDLDDALALSAATGWNQTADDWRIFFERGRVFAERDPAGRIVATAAALPYGETAWLSMVLVHPRWRHRGMAARLVEACLAHIDSIGAVAVLDATPAGEPVYGKVGFAAGFGLERWQGEARLAGSATASASAAAAGATGGERLSFYRVYGGAALEQVVALDRLSSGLDRRFLIRSFATRPATHIWRDGEHAFAMARAGARAWQLGPVVAESETQAFAIVERSLAAIASSGGSALGRSVFIDVPEQCSWFASGLQRLGFVRQRAFMRMTRGRPPATEPDARSFAVAGPEFG